MKKQDDMSERELLPCPFCSAGNTDIQERRLPPSMQGPGAIISVTVRHWCPVPPGQPSGLHVSMHGRDRESAIAAWNRRSPSRPLILEEAAKVADRMAKKWEPVALKGVHGCESVAREIRLLKGHT